MATTGKKKGTVKRTVVVSKKVKNYGNDPFFTKKAKAMEAVIKKFGLPVTKAHS